LYGIRSSRIQEFLGEIGTDFAMPDIPFHLGSAYHRGLVMDVARVFGKVSSELEDFFWLAAHLMIWGASDGTAEADAGMVNHYVQKYALPELQLQQFQKEDVDGVQSASLYYLTEILGPIEKEPQTAFVIMPFSDPFKRYYTTFYRPTLEHAGFRAFRAWGGLGDEDYIGLLTRIIEKVGLAWADVSKERVGLRQGERNPNVLYEIGAARALGVRVVIVVDSADATGLPANIGHEAVLEYTPDSDEWPRSAILDLSEQIQTEDRTDRTLRRRVRRILEEPIQP
jgi:hypothetical protein